MKPQSVFVLLFVFILSAPGWTNGKSSLAVDPVNTEQSVNAEQEDTREFVEIAKYDGSVQCEHKGIELGLMAREELKGIQIFGTKKQSDGSLRLAVCGAQTGYLNTYKILKKDLAKARKSGFVLLETILDKYRTSEEKKEE